MLDAFKHILNFFLGKDYSVGSKFLMFVLIILVLLLLNNLFGFTFYYESNQKISLIRNIEELKKTDPIDDKLTEFLKKKENEIIERKNLVDEFISLFSREDFKPNTEPDNLISNEIRDTVYILQIPKIYRDSSNYKSIPIPSSDSFISSSVSCDHDFEFGIDWNSLVKRDSVYEIKRIGSELEQNTEKQYRSKLWHTVTSSILFIILTLFVLILLLVFPFVTEKKDRFNTVVGLLAALPFLAFWIWLFQWLLGFIPVINNSPWINYLINISVNALILLGVSFYFSRKEKGSPKNKGKIH